MKYSLTNDAKELAKLLVQAWEKKDIGQRSQILILGEDVNVINLNIQNRPRFLLPSKESISHLEELRNKGLVEYKPKPNTRKPYTLYDELFLLQELRDAVESDFEMPEDRPSLPITVNGNIGSLNAHSTIHNQQNVGTNYGSITMTVQEIADELIKLLGEDLLNRHSELHDAIEALRVSDEQEKPSRIKKIVGALGNMLGLGADIVTIITPALAFLIPLL